MSRLGKKPVSIPEKTEVLFNEGVVTVKGPKGELKKSFRNDISIKIEGDKVILEPQNDSQLTKALWGTYSSHISNMVEGVNNGYQKKLILEGVGFKSEVKGDKLIMALGFSHPVHILIPEGLKVTAEKNLITISGIDKELVGQFSAEVRSNKKPEPYKGKGLRYEGEVIRRKQGKKTA